MNKHWLLAAIILVGLSCVSPAFAITTETRNDQNSDGISKFADPDEQKPAFMINAGSSGNNSGSLSSDFANVTTPTLGDNTPGARAFDESLSRQQNRQ